MRYKLLITGTNNMVIDEFFDYMESAEMDLVTTSLRYKDMVNHLNFYKNL